MINPLQTNIPQPDGSQRPVIIEPVLERDATQSLRPAGIYKIYKDAFGDETHLFTEPAEPDEQNDVLPDERNPDYLGKFITTSGNYQFDGGVLSIEEQEYLRKLIKDYQENQ